MPRRKTRNVTGIRGTGRVDASEVWRVLECGSRGCAHLMKVSEDTPGFPSISIKCPLCGRETDSSHIKRAPRWKYCRVCEWLQPIGETTSPLGSARGKTLASAFDYHRPTKGRSFRSERQLECRSCKREINLKLNPRRTADQHREASQRRRLYSLFAGGGKIDSRAVFSRFDGLCFKCGRPLTFRPRGLKSFAIDHTLPVRFLWPLTTDSATLLCIDCNNGKHDRWPSEFYSKAELKRLAVLTGIEYRTLAGAPILNEEAVTRLLADVNGFLAEWIRYPQEIIRIRKLVRDMAGIDIKDRASTWPSFLDK